jgi:hypothetical protein
MLRPSIPLGLNILVSEFTFSSTLVTPLPEICRVSIVEFISCAKDTNLKTFKQYGSDIFREAGRDAQIELEIRFVLRIAFASLMSSESESV